jgi:hypothetical protein
MRKEMKMDIQGLIKEAEDALRVEENHPGETVYFYYAYMRQQVRFMAIMLELMARCQEIPNNGLENAEVVL